MHLLLEEGSQWTADQHLHIILTLTLPLHSAPCKLSTRLTRLYPKHVPMKRGLVESYALIPNLGLFALIRNVKDPLSQARFRKNLCLTICVL